MTILVARILFISVLVSWVCCKKLPSTWWFCKNTHIYSLAVLEARSLKFVLGAKILGFCHRGWLLEEAPGQGEMGSGGAGMVLASRSFWRLSAHLERQPHHPTLPSVILPCLHVWSQMPLCSCLRTSVMAFSR